jgi:integrase
MSEERITRGNVIALWGNNFVEVTRWLGKLQEKDVSCWLLWKFCTWAKKTPTELLALKNDPASKQAEQLLDDFVNAETPEFTNPVKFTTVTAVKSFFKHNYRDLAKASGAITLIQQKEHKKPKKEDLRRLWNYAQNLRDKALITLVNSTALAKETLCELKWKYFEEGWEKKDLPNINCPSEILKGHGVGRYKGVRQITFLTPEAKRDLLNYKEWMEKRMGRKFELEDKVWRNTSVPYEPLSYSRIGDLILEISKNAGVRFSWHDGRRMVETSLEEVGIHPNWAKKIRGRKVRGEESPYSLPEIEKLRAKYREAVPLLQFTVEEKERQGDLRIKIAVDNLRQTGRFSESYLQQLENEWLGKEPEIAIPEISLEGEAVLRIADREGINLREDSFMISKDAINKEMEQIKRERSQPKTATNGGCASGLHCQRVVSEEQLEPLLAQGWRVAAVLLSGKIVVSNE